MPCIAGVIAGAGRCLAADDGADQLSARQQPIVSAPSRPESSPPLRDLALIRALPQAGPARQKSLATQRADGHVAESAALGTSATSATAPTLLGTFAGIDGTNGAGTPPDEVGAVGKTQYVQAINSSFAVYDKATMNLLAGPAKLNTLWVNYTGTNAGNGCSTQNDGDPMVAYDKAADRWIIAQLSLPNFSLNKGPSFECVAVSKTGDATGEYWLYDFQYNAVVNDDPKLGVWPDAYYVSFNLFNPSFVGPDYCAYDRASMLGGLPAMQHCYLEPATAIAGVPADLDGATLPPAGAPGYFLALRNSTSLTLWKLHVDWTTQANSSMTSVTITVPSYTGACTASACVTQPSPGGTISPIGDRMMYRVAYRNFGDHEALVANHSVTSGSVTGVRWYEIRSPDSTPVVTQAATFAPDNTLFRWNGSLAMDRKGDIALAYSTSNSSSDPSIFFTGRLAGDTINGMAGETMLFTGSAVETMTLSGSTPWGLHSSMSIDPVDDCTFWYTNEYYATTGVFSWSTRIGTLSFPACAQEPTTTLLSTACTTTFTAGQPFSMAAAVTPNTATGSIDFGDGQGGMLCGAVALAAGSASCTTSNLSAGTYPLVANYNGDSSDAPSDSNPLAVTVLPASDVIQRDGFEVVPNGCPAR